MIELSPEAQALYDALTLRISAAKQASDKTFIILDLPEDDNLLAAIDKLKSDGYRYLIAGRGNRIISWYQE